MPVKPVAFLSSNRIVRGTVCRIATLALPLLLTACAAAPGMKMAKPAGVAVSHDAQGTENTTPVPIVPIDASLITQLRAERNNDLGQAVRELSSHVSPYVVGAGDVLQITVWDHPELALAQGAPGQAATRASDPVPGFVIDQSGNLQFPYVGTVQAAGKTTEQIQHLLAIGLQKAFLNPQVTVRMASFRAKQIFVDGEVHTPGAQPLNDIPMTLYDAVSRAGGFASTADQSHLVLVRNGRSYPLDMTSMFNGGFNPARIVLRDGDLLRVKARDDSGVYVMGEVTKPATALPMRDGTLSLSDAISQAGSINSATADAAEVYVIRDSLSTRPQVYHLDAKSPVAMVLANQFELQAHDIVYVDGNGLVRFSRVLNLLLPAVNAALYGAIAGK
ncbi:polysaccharide biosynthesis/export family protein [Paraburkholderia sp. BCC1886]|uniref:polysaccharide biosynthesis/export family protein n=1 Tax=Paraburkholderia sp. BCC1886 TaxID=2562670 RepID=UPI001182E01F|nr:polysaccharide biosynthesis/export family protein [Paraburkholderia sp. BCC1886]